MSFELATTSKSLKIYALHKKNNLIKLNGEQVNQLKLGYKNEEQNEYIYYVHRDRNAKSKWFISKQDFHLMKLIAKLESNLKDTDEQSIKSKSNLNKVNLNDVYALQMNQIFWIKTGNQSQTLIENYLKEKLKKDRNLEKKLSDLIENNVRALVILKDLMQSRLQPNFEETIIKIEESSINS